MTVAEGRGAAVHDGNMVAEATRKIAERIVASGRPDRLGRGA
jgi:hypothetical protein